MKTIYNRAESKTIQKVRKKKVRFQNMKSTTNFQEVKNKF